MVAVPPTRFLFLNPYQFPIGCDVSTATATVAEAAGERGSNRISSSTSQTAAATMIGCGKVHASTTVRSLRYVSVEVAGVVIGVGTSSDGRKHPAQHIVRASPS